MNSKSRHGWTWVYRKLCGLHCSRRTVLYRATLYYFCGDIGTLKSQDNW